MGKKIKIKDEDFQKMEKVYKPRNEYIQSSGPFYFSYGLRIFFMFFAIFIIGFIAYNCFISSFSDSKNVTLGYEKKASIDYDVKLFENNLFDTGNLNAVDGYVSEIVDNISTDLYFNYKLDNESDIGYTYKVDAVLLLKNNKNGEPISENVYNLIEETIKEVKDTKEININQNINLDYDYYNNLAKNFNQLNQGYDVDITGSLYIKMYIDLNVVNSNFEKNLKDAEVVEVMIPLLSNQVNASMVESINEKDIYTEHEKAELVDELNLFIAVSLLILDTIFLLMSVNFIIKTTPKDSKYCMLRDRLLNEYDKLIVSSKNMPEIDSANVVNCTTFAELLDAQRLLKKPIVYHEIVKNQKCLFIVIGDANAYKYILKECDVDF